MVMANLATLLGGAMPYTSVALGLEGTVDGTNFSVLSSAQDEYVNAYRNSGGEAVFLDTYPNKTAIDQVTDLMQGQSPLLVASEEAALALADEEGGEFLVITPQRTRTPSVDAITHAIESGIYDTEGGAVIHAGEDYPVSYTHLTLPTKA